ncbi:GspE/PulE family protein [Microbacterium karelineae]|uniref:GspE/PulE family protein n=1 Tax=Microbacterium karelineae TaxID=2654283 RepID=UPI0012E9BE47|nr:GspE/PulE family protein [Microbacterium karelineae]
MSEAAPTTYDPATRDLLELLRTRAPERVDGAVRAIDEGSAHGATERLVAGGFVTAFEAAEAVARQWGLDVLDPADVDPSAIRALPLPLARRHGVVTVGMDASSVTVAMADPGDVIAIDDVRAATGLEPRPIVAAADDMRRLLDRYSREQHALGIPDDDEQVGEDVSRADADEPVIRYVSELIRRAIDSRASDVHIEPLDGEIRVRFRIDGVLHAVETMPSGAVRSLITRLKVMASLDIAERRLPQNGRISFSHEGRPVDIRLATMPTVRGEKAVLRVLDSEQSGRRLDSLDLTDRHGGILRAALARPHGLVLVTGPTGSGKSTTLYAALQEISRPDINIITIEDPVEYRLDGVNQMQINPKAGITFAAALPAILRTDPDVLLVGEIRDRTTAQLAIEAALTGHLVLTTLHTNDAPSAASRLREMGIEPFLLGASLDLVVAQRLARRLCTWCRAEHSPGAEELERLGWPVESLGTPERLWRPTGCRMCAGTGYRGRVALHEMMESTDRVEGLVVQGAATPELREAARAGGMRTLREDGFAKARDGITAAVEVLRVAR